MKRKQNKKEPQDTGRQDADKGEKDRPGKRVLGDTPIVISGGSATISFADKDNDGSNDFFEPGGHIAQKKRSGDIRET